MTGELKISFIGEMQKVEIKTGDVLVLEIDKVLSMDAHVKINEILKAKFPNNKILVLDKGIKLSVKSQEL